MEALIIIAAIVGIAYCHHLARKADERAALLKRVKDAQDAKRHGAQYRSNGLGTPAWSGPRDRDGNPL